jgi:hypothetical protein
MFYQIRYAAFTLILTMVSEMYEGVRVMVLKPMFIFTSQVAGVSLELKIWVTYRKSLTIVYGELDKDVPAQESLVLVCGDGRPVSVQHWAQNSQGDGQPEFNLCVRMADGAAWSRPVRLLPDKDQRQCLSVPGGKEPLPLLIFSHRVEGQVYVVFSSDEWPQLYLYNGLDVGVVCREPAGSETVVINPGETVYHTMKWIEKGFPFVEQKAGENILVFARHSPTTTGN